MVAGSIANQTVLYDDDGDEFRLLCMVNPSLIVKVIVFPSLSIVPCIGPSIYIYCDAGYASTSYIPLLHINVGLDVPETVYVPEGTLAIYFWDNVEVVLPLNFVINALLLPVGIESESTHHLPQLESTII